MSETSLNAKCGIEGFSYFEIFVKIWGFGTFFLFKLPKWNKSPKISTAVSSVDFCHLRETSLDQRWEVERTLGCFLNFFHCKFSGLGSGIPKLLKCPKFILKWLEHLGQFRITKSKTGKFVLLALYLCYVFICSLATPWPTFGYYV